MAAAVVPVREGPEQLLKQADSLKTTNYAESVALVQRLGSGAMKLSSEQQLYLRYLQAWQIAYRGDYKAAIPLLNSISEHSTGANLRFRAGITAVNMLGIVSHYQEAFARLSLLLKQLPQVTDNTARLQGLIVASQLYIEAGQYDLASIYTDQLLKEIPTSEGACKGAYLKLNALYRRGRIHTIDQQFQDGIDTCIRSGEALWANGIRYFVANLDIQHGQSTDAIKLLQENYAAVQRSRYPPLISEFNASLALAYWKAGDILLSKQFALDTVNSMVKNEYTESLATAYGLLYRIEKKQGDLASALAYHEKYMAADKGYLNEVSAKALAYQIVNQQVLAKKQQVDALSKQNQILTLQQSLDRKAAETSRLYIILLLTVLAFIALLTYRIKRSQLRFMRLARRDGLTGVYNRQHFLAQAERELQYCRKSARDACLVLIDLDHFKDFNDTYGHATGDRVLMHAVQSCQTHLRSTDVFGRLGGEEFGVLLPECGLDQVVGRVEQLRLAIATVADADVLDVVVSASFGVAATACSGYELRELLIHADDALYQAKNTGRNRAVVFDRMANLAREELRKSRVGTPAAAASQPNA
ncbi:MAG: GGDEF domain-containing protein [Pseudomonadota bacterium]|nr:GGDEF domain-containing protein [Pseudomonadota bacterium]